MMPNNTYGDPTKIKCLPHLMDELNKLDKGKLCRIQKVYQRTNHAAHQLALINPIYTCNRSFFFFSHKALRQSILSDLDRMAPDYPLIVITLSKNFVVTRFKQFLEWERTKNNWLLNTQQKTGKVSFAKKSIEGRVIDKLLNLFR